jgi:predicted ABC-type ATPase
MSEHHQAVMIVIAGPSGSGKSTVFPVDSFGMPWFNVDHWCAQMSGSYQSITPELRSLGGQECERFVYQMIRERSSFAVETTLRGCHAINQAKEARDAGLFTIMNYISTETLEVAIERVRRRGLSGGHAAPPQLIAEIYEKSHQNLNLATQVFHQVNIFTSPQEELNSDGFVEWLTPRLEARFINQELITLHTPIASWLSRSSIREALIKP